MNDSLPYLDIVLLGVLAVFLILRLRSVLGQRTGEEKPPRWTSADQNSSSPANSTTDKVVDLDQVRKQNPQKSDSEAMADAGDNREFSGPAADGLRAIAARDRGFDQENFLQGAAAAFEMVLGAYGAGDKKTLRDLLDDAVYQPFATAIDARLAAGQTLELSLVSLQPSEVLAARLDGKTAFVTVRFQSQQVMVLRDKDGAVIDGNLEQVQTVVDEWTFSRNVSSSDPNWLLVSTQSSEEG